MMLLLHVTAAANRDSIQRHGLDWRHGGGGIAGGRAPEQDGIFLSRDRWEADFFIRMGEGRFPALDLWEVALDGDTPDTDPRTREFDGFMCWMEAIPPSSLRLLERDITPPVSEPVGDSSGIAGYFTGF